MFSENDSAPCVVNLGLTGTLLGVVVRYVTHSNIAVLIGAVGGLARRLLAGCGSRRARLNRRIVDPTHSKIANEWGTRS